MNLGIRDADERRIEVLAQDLPGFTGAQLAVDITLRSALRASGETNLALWRWMACCWCKTLRDKENADPELVTSRLCRLAVVATEAGGRGSDEAADFLWKVALATAHAWERRWMRMIGTACAVSFDHASHTSGDVPSVATVLCHDQAAFIALGHGEHPGGQRNQGICDEGASPFPPRCVRVGHAVGVARDCEWHGASKSVSDSERLEAVHLASENVVVVT